MSIVRSRTGRSMPTRNWDLANVGNVFSEFDRLFNEMSSPVLQNGHLNNTYPIDLYETGEHVTLEMAVPGIKADDLDISIEGRQLSIRGRLPEGNDEGDRRYWLQSIPRGEFSRNITLPTTVVVDEVEAKVRDGLLVLNMPKIKEAKARKITIRKG